MWREFHPINCCNHPVLFHPTCQSDLSEHRSIHRAAILFALSGRSELLTLLLTPKFGAKDEWNTDQPARHGYVSERRGVRILQL